MKVSSIPTQPMEIILMEDLIAAFKCCKGDLVSIELRVEVNVQDQQETIFNEVLGEITVK